MKNDSNLVNKYTIEMKTLTMQFNKSQTLIITYNTLGIQINICDVTNENVRDVFVEKIANSSTIPCSLAKNISNKD